MSRVEFELNRKGVAALMKSSEMQKILQRHATKIKNRSGAGYEQDIYVGRNRANARVWASSEKAVRETYENNKLLKSVK